MFHSFRVNDSFDEAPGPSSGFAEQLAFDLQDASAYWRLDDLSGIDNSGRGNDLTINGSPVLEAGLISSNAVTFNDSTHNGTSYFDMDATSDTTLDSGENITVAGWVFPKSAAEQGPFSKWGDGSSPTANWSFFFRSDATTWNFRISSALGNSQSALPNNEWKFIAFSYNSTTGALNTRLNSTDDTQVIASGLGGVGTSSKITVGRLTSLANAFMWDGKVQGLGIWKRILSSAELDILFNNGDGIHVF